MIDRSQFDPVSGRARTERVIVREGTTRRVSFSVRAFVAVELRAWLLDAGFSSVDVYDRQGDPLTVQSRRMVTIGRR